jgi:hypothetical protein
VLIYCTRSVLDDVQRRYPAAHYVMVDDKPNLLAAMKTRLASKLTTVFVRQGHYALAADNGLDRPAARSGHRAHRRSARPFNHRLPGGAT